MHEALGKLFAQILVFRVAALKNSWPLSLILIVFDKTLTKIHIRKTPKECCPTVNLQTYGRIYVATPRNLENRVYHFKSKVLIDFCRIKVLNAAIVSHSRETIQHKTKYKTFDIDQWGRNG